jgi:hypothetical protein
MRRTGRHEFECGIHTTTDLYVKPEATAGPYPDAARTCALNAERGSSAESVGDYGMN